MGNENNQINISNNKINENDTKHATSIPESISDKLYNSIVRIEKSNIKGTGFFIKILIKGKLKHFLFTCFHVIEKNDIDSKKEIDLYYGKKYNETKISIELDNKRRFISCFEGEKDVTAIEIIDKDKIPENKYLLADLSYKYGYDIYKNGKFLLAGYPRDPLYENERHISSGEIKEIYGFEFEHSLDTRDGSSGAPICLFENNKVIGIHKQGDKIKPINYGTFIGAIIDELENEYKEIKSEKNMFNLFISLEEYNDVEYLSYHKEIIKKYYEQNENNFQKAYDEIMEYANNENIDFLNRKDLLGKNLEIFRNVYIDYNKIIRNYTSEEGIWNYMEFIHKVKDKVFNKLFNYFISGFLKSLNLSNTALKNNQFLYKGTNMDYEELINFKKNINEIICLKSFFQTTMIKQAAGYFFSNKDNYKVLFIIDFKYSNNCELDCFDISELSLYNI